MNAWPMLLAQNDAGDAAAGGIALLFGLFCQCVVPLIIIIPFLAGLWKIFEKAGKPGWAAIVPIYNVFVLTQISGKEILWFILALIPCVQIVALIIIWMDVAKNFGKDPMWGLGLAFLGPIFAPMLGFSDAKFQGPPSKF